MFDVLGEVILIAAAMTMGLMAGVFGIYANAIMPGLRRTDDRTFVAAFQSIDRAIINPAFMATFFGALILTNVALDIWLRPTSTRQYRLMCQAVGWPPSGPWCHRAIWTAPLASMWWAL